MSIPFEKFGILSKISKDGLIEGKVDLVLNEGTWYWKSEVIDEEREKDGDYPEFVVELPETLAERISDLDK